MVSSTNFAFGLVSGHPPASHSVRKVSQRTACEPVEARFRLIQTDRKMCVLRSVSQKHEGISQ
jgi:hypothetical protein